MHKQLVSACRDIVKSTDRHGQGWDHHNGPKKQGEQTHLSAVPGGVNLSIDEEPGSEVPAGLESWRQRLAERGWGVPSPGRFAFVETRMIRATHGPTRPQVGRCAKIESGSYRKASSGNMSSIVRPSRSPGSRLSKVPICGPHSSTKSSPRWSYTSTVRRAERQ
jgi:hypothetical protein